MTMHLTKAPYQGVREPLTVAPNAALLIDFDNVTMGMRSDLSKELKTLLNSDIIKGKVTVQRAYADWRRYPQYIVPLSEASIDLIFAPAYGSSKKNATDIRMAIDGMELVFIRPEIGTFILLTGDSDFSSLVLKLKEYGKYVIGVGIQESSSDILVQNCDEYYSYTSLSGLRKTTDSDRQPVDPWVLVERAVEQMTARGDVMRSDRLKQVMVEIDPGFDESEYGFSKFSRFLTEASSKGLVQIKKLENGQYEVAPSGRKSAGGRGEGSRAEEPKRNDERSRSRSGRDASSEGRSRGRDRSDGDQAPVADGPPLQAAYGLMRQALERLLSDGRDAVRDSDVKRKMLELEPGFSETNLGFSKFSRFLRQADDQDVVQLRRRDSGNYEVSLHPGGNAAATDKAAGEHGARPTSSERASSRPGSRSSQGPRTVEPKTQSSPPRDGSRNEPEPRESALAALGRRLGLNFGSPKRPTQDPAVGESPPASVPDDRPAVGTGARSAPVPSVPSRTSSTPASSGSAASTPTSSGPAASPPTSSGLGVSGPASSGRTSSSPTTPAPGEPEAPSVDPSMLGLPTDTDAQVRYLANSYSGVGKKTAEKLVEGFGEDLFTVLQQEPERVQEVIPAARAENVLEQWKVDLDRRRTRLEGGAEPESRQGGGRERAKRPSRRSQRASDGDGRGDGGSDREDGLQGRDEVPSTSSSTSPVDERGGTSEPLEAPAPQREDRVEKVERATEATPAAQAERGEAVAPDHPAPAEAKPDAATTSGIPDLDDLEPSRLHTRTSRRGRRR